MVLESSRRRIQAECSIQIPGVGVAAALALVQRRRARAPGIVLCLPTCICGILGVWSFVQVCLTSYFLEGSHDLRHQKSSQSGSTCGVRSPSPRCHPDSKTPVVVVVGGGGGCCAACELQPTFWLILWDSIVDCGLPAVSLSR